MFELIFHEEAAREYVEAYLWYDLKKIGLGDVFKIAVTNALQKLKNNPQFFSFSRKPFREISVDQFPYTIVFEIETSKPVVFVSAIYHTARNPKKKYRK